MSMRAAADIRAAYASTIPPFLGFNNIVVRYVSICSASSLRNPGVIIGILKVLPVLIGYRYNHADRNHYEDANLHHVL